MNATKWGVLATTLGLTMAAAIALLDYAEEQRLDNQISLMEGRRDPGIALIQSSRVRRMVQKILRKDPPLRKYVIQSMPMPGFVRRPILLIPGLGCSRLYDRRQGNRLVWVSLSAMLPKTTSGANAWKESMRCRFDSGLRDWVPSDEEGVTAWPHYDASKPFRMSDHLGGTAGCCDTVEALQAIRPKQLAATTGFRTMVEAFCRDGGYEVGHTLFGMGYDYRRITGVRYWATVVGILEELCRAIRIRTGGHRIAVVTHSMGGLVLLAAMRTNPAIAAHIDFWCPINAPWGGAPRAVQAVLSGSAFGLNFFSAAGQTAWFQDLIGEWSGLLATFPRATVYDPASPIVKIDDDRSYNASDPSIAQLLLDTGNQGACAAWLNNVVWWRELAMGSLARVRDELPSHLVIVPMITNVDPEPSGSIEWSAPSKARHMADAFWYRRRDNINHWAADPSSFAARHRMEHVLPQGGSMRTALARSCHRYLERVHPVGQNQHMVRQPRASMTECREEGPNPMSIVGDGTVSAHSLSLATLLGDVIVIQKPHINHTAALNSPLVIAWLLRNVMYDK
jgi:pimeloyl-ACP methyl ester carboxylesterase